jgi:hypothetical protein
MPGIAPRTRSFARRRSAFNTSPSSPSSTQDWRLHYELDSSRHVADAITDSVAIASPAKSASPRPSSPACSCLAFGTTLPYGVDDGCPVKPARIPA